MSQRRAMEQEGATNAVWMPETDHEREAIREQLERLLASSLFKNSRRYPALLRYVVERTLRGHGGDLKERTLGIEVFGRAEGYDTNLDPIVRTTAGEIRKRIAQYYHESGHEREVRIDLPCGSYTPEFREPLEPVVRLAPVPEPEAPPRRNPWARRGLLAVAASLAIVAAAAAVRTSWQSHPGLDQFWQPVIESSNPVLLCIGVPPRGHQELLPPEPSVVSVAKNDRVAFTDAVTLAGFAGLLQTRGKAYRIRRGSSATFAELREGPAVLIGGFNNDWTLRVVGALRYGFARDDSDRMHWIEDRRNPSMHDWVVDMRQPHQKFKEDYAIISRIWDGTTDRPVVIAAGIMQYGTLAAGEFLTDPKYLDEVIRQAPPTWKRKNMQAVIATKVIGDNSGPPRVLATYFW